MDEQLSEDELQRLNERHVGPLGDDEHPPPPGAVRFAVRQLLQAESRLNKLFATSPGSASPAPLVSKNTGDHLRYDAAHGRDPAERIIRVVPLTLTFCPELAVLLYYQVPTRKSAPLRPKQQQFAAQLAHALRTEDDLWVKAGQERIPRARVKEPREAREWPAHAVMPHTRGMWWLKCEAAACTAPPFVGRRQAKRCNAHRAVNVTSSRRTALRP